MVIWLVSPTKLCGSTKTILLIFRPTTFVDLVHLVLLSGGWVFYPSPYTRSNSLTKTLTYSNSVNCISNDFVTGVGDYFSSGNDLTSFTKPLQSGTPILQVAQEGRAILRKFVAAFIDCTKPLVALVNGPAVGISVTTLGLYDLVLAADQVSVFCLSIYSTPLYFCRSMYLGDVKYRTQISLFFGFYQANIGPKGK